MNRPITHIIFDLDNTITNERQSASLAQTNVELFFKERYKDKLSERGAAALFSERNFRLAQTFVARGIQSQLPKNDWRRLYFSELVKNCSFTVDINELVNEYSKFKARTPNLISGARSAIKYLHDRYTLSIATNSTTDVSALQLESYFVDIARAADLGVRKPDKLFFEKTLKRVHKNGESTLLIGDDQFEDVHGGKNAGLLTMWFNRKKESLSISLSKPDYIISSWREVKRIL